MGTGMSTFLDKLFKYTLAIPIQQQDTVTVAKVVVEAVGVKFGICQMILHQRT
jgi:hypothetical protein